MTENDFRFRHSELIEFYQLIEMRLKGICAEFVADEEKGWFDRLDDYESDSFGLLLKETKKLQKQKQIDLLTQEEFSILDEIRKKRNFWVHQCFGLYPIVFKKGELRHSESGKKLCLDLDEAKEWDRKLTETTRKLTQINTTSDN